MRQIYLDLTNETARPPTDRNLGFIGEHNATELLISVPQSMITESDYLVAVFLSGPLTFRSRRIYPTTVSGSAYIQGNCLHCLLGKHLTAEPLLGVQVECFKLDSSGESVFIGKTQFISKLTFKPSPQGHPGFGFDGSYEDIQIAVDSAHSHGNTASLNKISESSDGGFLFDGVKISGIEEYDDFSSLPETAEDGTIAYVSHSELITSASQQSFSGGSAFGRLRFRGAFEADPLSPIVNVIAGIPVEGGGSLYQLRCYLQKPSTGEYVGALIMSRFGSAVNCILIGGLLSVENAAKYVPLTGDSVTDDEFYVYNLVDGFDLSLLTNAPEPCNITVGWYRVKEIHSNFHIDTSGANPSVAFDTDYDVSAIDFSTSPLAEVMKNVEICAYDGTDIINPDAYAGLLSNVLEAEEAELKPKGLYVSFGGEWTACGIHPGFLSVETPSDLPSDALDGTLAIVRKSRDIYDPEVTYNHLSAGSVRSSMYLNPVLASIDRLLDFSVSVSYTLADSGSDMTWSGGSFEIVTDVESGYLLLVLRPNTNYEAKEYYLYAWNNDSVVFDAGNSLIYNAETFSVSVSEGWNRMEYISSTGEFTGAVHVAPGELPKFIKPGDNSERKYSYSINSAGCSYYPGSSFPQRVISQSPFFASDNAAGIWIFTNGEWDKADDTDKYITEV